MNAQTGPRKRQAPGTIAINNPPLSDSLLPVQQSDPVLSTQDYTDLLASFQDNPQTNDASSTLNFPMTFPSAPQKTPLPSTELIRRDNNQQLTTRPPDSTPLPWSTADDDGQSGKVWDLGSSAQDVTSSNLDQDDPAKKKQIPPFVLKLWKVLDSDEYVSLIRWTDNGTAFIVLNEQEFAKTVIPEFFKHNNFASFVRQLNMYGFSKRPSIHAHSMKAAERKVKEPPIWSHKYFQRGREDLLCLIQRPPNRNSTGKRRHGQDSADHGDSDEESHQPPSNSTSAPGRLDNTSDLITMPRTEVNSLRDEVSRLQQQQNLISKMIAQLKQKNEQFYRQASDFQTLHDRHENSINAILTFLATFYNRSLEAGVNLNDMFGGLAAQQPQRTVVDVDADYLDSNLGANGHNNNNTSNTQVQRYRGPQLLLENSPARMTGSAASRMSSSSPASGGYQAPKSNSALRSSYPTTQPAVDLPANNNGVQQPETSAQPTLDSPEMLSLINAANASTPPNGSDFDFSSVLDHAQHANGQRPLTPDQRNQMLNLIASQTQPAAASQPDANNALMNPTPPPMPNLDQYIETQESLSRLTKMQREQDENVQQLAGRLSPLSPNGKIAGLNDMYGFRNGSSSQGNGPLSGDFDMDAFINSNPNGGDDNYFGDFTSDMVGGDANTTMGMSDGDGDGMGLFGNTGSGGESSTRYDTNNDNEVIYDVARDDTQGRVESLGSGSGSSLANSPRNEAAVKTDTAA